MPKVVQAAVKDIWNTGHTKTVWKSDRELAMKALASRTKDMRVHTTVVEALPDYESEGNGLAQRCARTTKWMHVTMRSDLEHRIGGKIPNDHAILMYLVKHSASMHSRYDVRNDFRTPCDHMFMTRGPNKEETWPFGVWLCLV